MESHTFSKVKQSVFEKRKLNIWIVPQEGLTHLTVIIVPKIICFIN